MKSGQQEKKNIILSLGAVNVAGELGYPVSMRQGTQRAGQHLIAKALWETAGFDSGFPLRRTQVEY